MNSAALTINYISVYLFLQRRSGKINNICLSPVLIRGFCGGGKLEKREIQPLFFVIFSTSTPGERIPEFASPHPIFSYLSFSPHS